jgi:hypothetical protein
VESVETAPRTPRGSPVPCVLLTDFRKLLAERRQFSVLQSWDAAEFPIFGGEEASWLTFPPLLIRLGRREQLDSVLESALGFALVEGRIELVKTVLQVYESI